LDRKVEVGLGLFFFDSFFFFFFLEQMIGDIGGSIPWTPASIIEAKERKKKHRHLADICDLPPPTCLLEYSDGAGRSWSKDCSTKLWVSNSSPRTERDVLFRDRGCTFRLLHNGFGFDIVVVIGGRTIPLLLSTTRRTLTLSSKDTQKYALEVDEEDFVCSLPAKRSQLYCGAVTFLEESSKNMIVVPRQEYFVGDGNFKSRLGLIGCLDRKSIFTFLRLRTDMFSISFDERSGGELCFGDDALPSERACPIELVEFYNTKKPLLVFECDRMDYGSHSYKTDLHVKGIVHLEIPHLCVPLELYKKILTTIVTETGLFKHSPVETWERVRKHLHTLPTLRIRIKATEDRTAELLVAPRNYIVPSNVDNEEVRLGILPVEQIQDVDPFIVLGNRIFMNKRTTFSLSKKKAWLE
jgi:hypothetical protein